MIEKAIEIADTNGGSDFREKNIDYCTVYFGSSGEDNGWITIRYGRYKPYDEEWFEIEVNPTTGKWIQVPYSGL